MSLKHFKKLYEVAKNEGIASALQYDLAVTAMRHPNLAIELATIFDGFSYSSRPNNFEPIVPEPVVRNLRDYDSMDLPSERKLSPVTLSFIAASASSLDRPTKNIAPIFGGHLKPIPSSEYL